MLFLGAGTRGRNDAPGRACGICLLGESPFKAFGVFFIEPVSDMNGLSELLLKLSRWCLIALGLSIRFRAGI